MLESMDSNMYLVCSLVSSIKEITSGVVEGSVLGPDLYSVVADSLVLCIRLALVAYAYNFKFVSDVALYESAEMQTENKHHLGLVGGVSLAIVIHKMFTFALLLASNAAHICTKWRHYEEYRYST